MPRRLTLVIHSLEGGGAERTLNRLSNYWADSGNQVTLITLAGPDRDAYAVDPRVQRVAIDAMRESKSTLGTLANTVRRVKRLRRAIRNSSPDCVIAFTQVINVLTRLAMIGIRTPMVATERTDPRHHVVGGALARLMRWTYPRCAAVVVQTRSVAEHYSDFIAAERLHVIANGVKPLQFGVVDLEVAPRRIVSMGRLSPEKGFESLLRAFAQTRSEFPEWSLRILGEGPQRERLETLIRELKLESSAELAGWISQPESVLREASLYVLSSDYEGFPNALLEAMSIGLPAVSYACPSGPEAILRDQIDGILVPPGDVDALAQAMMRLMGDAPLRQGMGCKAVEVMERFALSKSFAAWDRLLDELLIDE